MIPAELQKPTPRDIKYTDDLFKANRKKVRGILIGSVFIIPLVGVLFWAKFDDLVAGIIWGICIAAFFELFAFGLWMNAKKAVNVVQNGVVAMATVQKAEIKGNKGKYTSENSSGYIFINVLFKDDLGQQMKGMVTYIGGKKEIDLKEGDEVPVMYLKEKPNLFIIYSPTMGISTFGRCKLA